MGERRRGLLRVAGSLRFRLILSYSLVTLTVLVSAGIVAAATDSLRGDVPVDQAGALAILIKDTALAPYLDAGALQPDAIRLGIEVPVMSDLSRTPRGHPLAAAVFNVTGQLVAEDSCTREQYSRAGSTTCTSAAHAVISSLLSSAAVQQAVRQVTLGQTDGRTVTGMVARRGYAAAPLVGAGKQPAGALLVVFAGAVPPPAGQSPPGRFLSLLAANWPQNWVPILLLTLVIGTGTGMLLSHQLVRRLRGMASTVRVWSRGDLGPAADASGTDELASLAADLNHMGEQIRNLLQARREIAMQQERNRVRRELHDGVKQELFGISMQLATAHASLDSGGGGVARYLEEAQRLGQRAQRELTAIMEDLRPPLLRLGHFGTALAELTVQFQQESGIRAVLESPEQVTLPADHEDALFRVIQEALTNVRRHSAASQVIITITSADGGLRLTVADDGRGLPPDLPGSESLGLSSMRQRVEALGGNFTIRSASPGACIEITIPAPATGDMP